MSVVFHLITSKLQSRRVDLLIIFEMLLVLLFELFSALIQVQQKSCPLSKTHIGNLDHIFSRTTFSPRVVTVKKELLWKGYNTIFLRDPKVGTRTPDDEGAETWARNPVIP